MPGIFKIKILWIGLFLAFPPMAAWALRGGSDETPTPPSPAPANAVEETRVRMPVEVITKGGKTEWVMVEVAAGAIPEPGTTTLLMVFSSLCLLRRQREE